MKKKNTTVEKSSFMCKSSSLSRMMRSGKYHPHVSKVSTL